MHYEIPLAEEETPQPYAQKPHKNISNMLQVTTSSRSIDMTMIQVMQQV
jgi:hypothetical protein